MFGGRSCVRVCSAELSVFIDSDRTEKFVCLLVVENTACSGLGLNDVRFHISICRFFPEYLDSPADLVSLA